MKAKVTGFTRSNQKNQSYIQVTGGSDSTITYCVKNADGFYNVEVEGKYDTPKKRDAVKKAISDFQKLINER